MGRDNNNAGMHYVHFSRNVFEPNEYDKYTEMIAEQKAKKKSDQEWDCFYKKVLEREYDKYEKKNIRKIRNQIREKVSVNEAYQNSCILHDKLINNLFIICVDKHIKFDVIADIVARYWEEQRKDEELDVLSFVSMVTQMIGVSFEALVSVDDEYTRKVVYESVIANIDTKNIEKMDSCDGIDYIEATIQLVDFSDPEAAGIYAMIGFSTDMIWDSDIIRKFLSLYEVNICRRQTDEGDREYKVFLSEGPSESNNYLSMYHADVYSEKEGRVVNFFEKTFICS